MKIKLPTIDIETEEYKATIEGIMNYYGYTRAEAKDWLRSDLTSRAEMHCRHLLEEFNLYGYATTE